MIAVYSYALLIILLSAWGFSVDLIVFTANIYTAFVAGLFSLYQLADNFFSYQTFYYLQISDIVIIHFASHPQKHQEWNYW